MRCRIRLVRLDFASTSQSERNRNAVIGSCAQVTHVRRRSRPTYTAQIESKNGDLACICSSHVHCLLSLHPPPHSELQTSRLASVHDPHGHLSPHPLHSGGRPDLAGQIYQVLRSISAVSSTPSTAGRSSTWSFDLLASSELHCFRAFPAGMDLAVEHAVAR